MATRVADSLEEAGPRDLVHIDADGRVRSRAKTRLYSTLYWGTLATLVGLEGYLGYSLFGLPGLSIAAVLGGYVGWVGSRLVHLRRGLGLLAESKLEGADALFTKVASSRVTPRRLRARAWAGLAASASLRGDPEKALEHLRESVRLQGKSKRAIALTSKHSEVKLLARLGNTAEARALIGTLPKETPAGEYARLSHHSTHLYLAFREGKHHFDDDELHEMSSFALTITSAAPLLALLAWAFEQNGDDEMRQLLFDEAADRHPGDLLSMTMPELQRWMDGEPPLLTPDAEELEEEEHRSTGELRRRKAGD